MRREVPKILQQARGVIQPVKTRAVIRAEKTIEPKAVENINSSSDAIKFKLRILFASNWPELKNAKKMRRNNAKSISIIKIDLEIKFVMNQTWIEQTMRLLGKFSMQPHWLLLQQIMKTLRWLLYNHQTKRLLGLYKMPKSVHCFRDLQRAHI